MTLRSALLLATTFFACSYVHAQVSFGGQPYGTGPCARPTRGAGGGDAGGGCRSHDGRGCDRDFKQANKDRFDSVSTTRWTSGLEQQWRLEHHAQRRPRVAVGYPLPGAYSINFEFDEYVVPEGAKVFVYNETGDVLGGFTEAEQSRPHGVGGDATGR